jgi:hypothetical protein
MSERMNYEDAKERVEQLRGFYMHLAAFLLVNLFLIVTNWLTSPGDWWFYWPLFGWGIGLTLHGFSVFFDGGIFGKQWESKKIKELMGDNENPADK